MQNGISNRTQKMVKQTGFKSFLFILLQHNVFELEDSCWRRSVTKRDPLQQIIQSITQIDLFLQTILIKPILWQVVLVTNTTLAY